VESHCIAASRHRAHPPTATGKNKTRRLVLAVRP